MQHRAAHAPRRDSPGAGRALNSELSDPARPAGATCRWDLSPHHCCTARPREEMGVQVITQISLQCSSFRLLNPPLCCSHYLFLAAQIRADTAGTLRIEERSGAGTSLLHGHSSASHCRPGSRSRAGTGQRIPALPSHRSVQAGTGCVLLFGEHTEGTGSPREQGPRSPCTLDPEEPPGHSEEGDRVGPWAPRRALSPWGGWALRGSPRSSAVPTRHSHGVGGWKGQPLGHLATG